MGKSKHGSKKAKEQIQAAHKNGAQSAPPKNPSGPEYHGNSGQVPDPKPPIGWLERATFVVVLFAAAGAVCSGIYARRQANIAKDTFDATVRPYVAIIGTPIIRNGPTPEQSNAMTYGVEIKNVGSVPATQFTANWEIYIGGIFLPDSGIPDAPTTLFPTQTINMSADLTGSIYTGVFYGTKILIMNVWFSYNGPGDAKYTSCEKYQYIPRIGGFVNLGPLCKPQ
jgi:hypothetical protein